MRETTRAAGYGGRRWLVHAAVAIAAVFATALPARAAALVWAFGDSLTAGYGLPRQQGFTAQLQRALRADGLDVTVANGGVSGDTSAQGRARLLWGLRGLGRTPDLAIVELGANDMLRGLPVAQAKANLDAILAELARRHIPVLLAGMRASPNLGPAYARDFDAIYPDLARSRGVRRYPFFLAGVAARRGLLQADGLHPNAQGVAIIVAGIAPAVRAALIGKH